MKKILGFSVIALAVLSGCTNTSSTSSVASSSQSSLLSDTLVVSPNDTREYKTLTLENEIEVILVSDPQPRKQ